MDLTREQAISWHKRVWEEMADSIESNKRVIDVGKFKENFCIGHGFYIVNDCFLCEYSCLCSNCPVLWGANSEDTCGGLIDGKPGLYHKVTYATTWQEQAGLARQIANLPERTVE